MSIRKDPRSPYWQYDFQRNKQRYHGSTGCTKKRDAEAFESNLKRRVALGDDSRPPLTLDVACKGYWTDKGQHEANSGTTLYQLDNLSRMIGPHKFVGDIRQADMRAFVLKRRATVSPASVNRELSLCQRVLKHAQAGGYDVPYPGTENAIKWADLKLAEPKERVRELSGAEQRKLFEHLGDDLAAVVEFAILSGQRRGAVIGLRWADVDLEAARARVHTKGDVWHTFPLTTRMIEVITSRPQLDGCPFVFTYKCERPSPKRGDRPARRKGVRYPFSAEGWKRRWATALKAAGITDFRFHDLRHTSATRVIRSSGNLKAAQKLLGHTDISTTARYAHVLEDDLRAIMADTESRNNYGELLQEGGASATVSAENESIE